MKTCLPAGSRSTVGVLDRRTVLAGGLALAGAACGLSGCTSAAESGPSAAPSSNTSNPAAASDRSDLGAQIAEIVEPLMTELMVPGVIVAVRTAKESWRRAFGRRALGSDSEPVTVNDHFRIGSNTKTMTGTCLLQLVDERAVDLDDDVQDHLPQVTSDKLRGVTISQLLDMRSGLHSYSELRSFNEVLDSDPSRAWRPDELVALGLS